MSPVQPVGESTGRRLRHEVRARHATTGEPLPVRAAFADRPPRGWELRTLFGLVVVTEATAVPPIPAPAPPGPVRLRLEVADPAVAARLATPTALVDLDQPVVTSRFNPAPSVLEIHLVDTAGPRTGRTVVAHPSAGPDVPLPEQPADPGVYRSAPTAWTAAFHPFEIRVDGLLLRRAFIDVTRRTTRIRLVDPA